MSRLWFVIILLSIFRITSSSLNKKGYYTIVTPANVRFGSVFHVSITLNDFNKSCWFNISLTGNNEQIFSGLENIEIKPGTTKLVELRAPALNEKQLNGILNISGYRGIISEKSALIFFENDKVWVFIQTNKPKYRPGELVEFRVICIDQLKRPAKLNDDIIVEIFDDNKNLVKSISDAKLVRGVFRSKFELSDYPVLGRRWEINVLTIDKRLLGTKRFDVNIYDFPKFNVIINNPNKTTIYDDMMLLEINARYFFGKPVKGNLSLIVSTQYDPRALVVYKYQIDGKIEIPLELKTDLQLPYKQNPNFVRFEFDDLTPSIIEETFNIEVIVVDDLSEEVSQTTTKVAVYTQPYKIELQAPSTFISETFLNFKVKVHITDLDDNRIVTTSQPVGIMVECRENLDRYNNGETDLFRFESDDYMHEYFLTIQLTNKNYSECFMYAEYGKSKSSKKWIQKKKEQSFDIEILTENPQEGKELEIKIRNSEQFEEFSYEIVSKGDIIDSGHRNVPGNQTTHILRLNVTFSMVPKITIYVHLIKNKQFIGQLKDVLIKSAVQNSIEIYTENETRPGAGVYINVTTDEGSYVGLMGLDRRILQNINEKDILNNDYVNAELGNVNSLIFYDQFNFNGRIGDIITLSNLFLPLPPPRHPDFVLRGGEWVFEFKSKIDRLLFPESWLFLDFEKTTAGGLHILETVPDSITTWALTGFSINPESGLALTRNSTALRVFKEFFVSMDLPTLVKDNEVIEVPVYISNYLNQNASTTITIETSSEDLLIFDNPEGTSEFKKNISRLIAANEIDEILFYMKPLKPGHYNVTVLATSSVGSDAVQKLLNVQPQGIPYAMSKAYLVHLPEEGMQEGEITIDIPENAVSGSERVEVSLIGDIFGPLMKTLQKLARVPYGNCEENTQLLVSNSLTLKYLKVLNSSNPSLEKKLRHNIELGYQNQLSFKYLDGSFGSFNQKQERTGDIWQTVFSLWGLRQANEFVPIDPWVIKRGLQYLKFKQQDNGCFTSGSGIDEDVKNTVFGLMVFLMDERSKKDYYDVITKGLEFLNNITDDLEYSSISVLSVYGLLLGTHEKAKDHLMKLTHNSDAHLTSKQILWTRPDSLQAHLETTTESLINLFESQEIPDKSLLQIVRGLIFSKIEETSVTHMIALQAMVKFVEKLSLNQTKVDVTIKDDQQKSGSFEINLDNSRVFQTFEIAQKSRKISIQSKGHGFAVVDVRYYYNILPESQSSSSLYTINISTLKPSKHSIVLQICVSTNSTDDKVYKMNVNLQSGFIFADEKYQEDIKRMKHIYAVQTSTSRNKVVVYFELKQSNETCVKLIVRKAYKVFNSKPGLVTIYDVYEKDQKSGRSFMINDF